MGIAEPRSPAVTAASRFLIVGGAGFIGSHFTDRLLASARTAGVTLYDNFSSGRAWHYEAHAGDRRLQVVRADVHDFAALRVAGMKHPTVMARIERECWRRLRRCRRMPC